jgi:hypothetical protein
MESETKDALNVELVKVLQQLLVLRRQPLVMLLLLGASKTALLPVIQSCPKSNDDVVERGNCWPRSRDGTSDHSGLLNLGRG